MTRPVRHPKTGVYWFRKRVPAGLVALVGKREEKRSLGTKDPHEAKLVYIRVVAEVESRWAALRIGTVGLGHREAHGLAGEIYRDIVARHERDPGSAWGWNVAIDQQQRLQARRDDPWAELDLAELIDPEIRHVLDTRGIAVDDIPPDQADRIFEPFFTTKEVGKGTGLGLSQVFGFAKQSGGDVNVESAMGNGTTFTLYLPRIEAVTYDAPVASRDDAPFQAGDGHRVLVVEDNVEVGRFATQILEDCGYLTTWATNAEEALDALGSDGAGFDVVFSDVVMPGMGGIALARLLQRRFPDLPVLLASGYSHVLERLASFRSFPVEREAALEAAEEGRVLAKRVEVGARRQLPLGKLPDRPSQIGPEVIR